MMIELTQDDIKEFKNVYDGAFYTNITLEQAEETLLRFLAFYKAVLGDKYFKNVELKDDIQY